MRKAVDNAVMTVENRMHDAILTAMDKMVIPRVEMAVRSITGSSGHGLNGIVQNPDWGEFTGNTENTPLMSASSRLDLNIDQKRIEETRDIEYFEDGDFPAFRPNYDRRAHTHHIFTSRKKLLYTKKTTLKRSVNGGILLRKSGVHRYFSTPRHFGTSYRAHSSLFVRLCNFLVETFRTEYGPRHPYNI